MNKRLDKLMAQLDRLNLDAFLIHHGLNRRYISGFTGSTAYLYISKNQKVLLTDFRYIEQAAKECPDFEVLDMAKEGLVKSLNSLLEKDVVARLGFEEQTVTYHEYTELAEALKVKEFVGVSDVVETIRMIKDEEELSKIEKAVAIGDAAFEHLLKFIKVGQTEKEIALELEFFMRKAGASKLSFDSIIASGLHSSMPHAQPTDKKLEVGDFLTMDFGCIYEGYCSDMTRTIVLGQADEKQKAIYETVLKAQVTAIEKIQAGITGKAADKVARDIISEAGYGDYFGHGLGHAVGLYIHESPRLTYFSLGDYLLAENMVVTVEPGIYLPGFGGVRIEDLVVVKNNGVVNFTHSPKELIEVI